MQELYEHFGYLATWLPGVPISVGDIGTVRHGRYERITSLEQLGVAVSVLSSGEIRQLDYASAGHLDIGWSAQAEGGSVAPGTGARVRVELSRAYAVLFQALDASTRAIEDLNALRDELGKLAAAGVWRREYVVVTEVVRTGATVVLMAGGSGGRMDFTLDAPVAAGPLGLVHAAGGLAVASEAGMAVRVVAPQGLSPLFRASSLRSTISRRPRLVSRGEGADVDNADPDSWELRPITYASLDFAAEDGHNEH